MQVIVKAHTYHVGGACGTSHHMLVGVVCGSGSSLDRRC